MTSLLIKDFRYYLNRIVLPLLFIWLITSGILAWRLNNYGAFASIQTEKMLVYIRDNAHAQPASIRLNQSYSQWALALNLSDASNYIRAGLGFADGKGVSIRNITPENPNNKTYLPYYFQSPGAPILIGLMIKLFGEQSVLPYFILILTVHFITALLTCLLVSRFLDRPGYIFGAGLLSLLCLPTLDFNFGIGIFCAEPLAAPFVVSALIALSNFWTETKKLPPSYRRICLYAIGFGSLLAVAAYFRDIYTAFAQFCLLILILVGLIQRKKFKYIVLFSLISILTLSAIEYPWQKRNAKCFGQFTMTGSTYYGYSLWHTIWDNNTEYTKWSWNAGMGIGNYLAPDKSAQVLTILNNNPKAGSKYALRSLIKAVCKKPWEAIIFKLKVYDTLWFGQRCHWPIYLWCVISTISFLAFLFITRFQFIPELWLFPLFLLCISPLIHFEHRYSQPFFFFITPITLMCMLRYFQCRSTPANSLDSVEH